MRIFGISASGLYAAQTRMDVTANNVANVLSDGFKRSRTIAQARSAGIYGVDTTIQQIKTPGPPGPPDPVSGETRELSNVDLGQEMVDLVVSQRAFEANLVSLKTADEMVGTVIDTIV